MLIKPRTLPTEIKKLRALKRRMPELHPKTSLITDQLNRYEAGFNGEKSLDFPLSFIDPATLIFHNLRLHDGQHHFQMDTLLLTPQLAIILEVKNYSGTLTFDGDFHQVIRKKENIEEAFSDPLLQVKRQQQQLSFWIYQYLGITMEVESLVVMANDRSVLKTSPGHSSLASKIVNRSFLPYRINELIENHKGNPPQPLEQLSHTLIAEHEEYDRSFLDHYELSLSDLKTGVTCPKCNTLAMKRQYGKWVCPQCYSKSETAHMQALEDYDLLIDYAISNREARGFLHVPSRYVVHRLLQNLESTGQGRNRKYLLKK